MGRAENPRFAPSAKCYLRRVYLNAGGYDQGGAYWGHGEPLLLLQGATEREGFGEAYYRATSRQGAKAKALADYPGIRFHR
jgi:hypothetical protein